MVRCEDIEHVKAADRVNDQEYEESLGEFEKEKWEDEPDAKTGGEEHNFPDGDKSEVVGEIIKAFEAHGDPDKGTEGIVKIGLVSPN